MVGFVCGFKLRRDRVAARAEFAMAQRDQYAQTSALFLRARWCAVNLFAHTLYVRGLHCMRSTEYTHITGPVYIDILGLLMCVLYFCRVGTMWLISRPISFPRRQTRRTGSWWKRGDSKLYSSHTSPKVKGRAHRAGDCPCAACPLVASFTRWTNSRFDLEESMSRTAVARRRRPKLRPPPPSKLVAAAAAAAAARRPHRDRAAREWPT